MNIKIENMSLGTQKKFLIIAALIADTKILLMDEPTNALDQESKMLLVDLINKKTTDCSVILATHDQEFMGCVGSKVLELRDASIFH